MARVILDNQAREGGGRELPAVPPAVDKLETIAAPTLVLTGEHEDSEIVAIATALSTRIPDASTVQKLPGGGHLAALERPAVFNAVLEAFLRSFRGQSG
jgi:3-oxoadipate enol-lactonase